MGSGPGMVTWKATIVEATASSAADLMMDWTSSRVHCWWRLGRGPSRADGEDGEHTAAVHVTAETWPSTEGVGGRALSGS